MHDDKPHLLICKAVDGSGKRVYWRGNGWSTDRTNAIEFPIRKAALAVHEAALKHARPAGYRTPIAVVAEGY